MICTYKEVITPRPRKRTIGLSDLKNGLKGIITGFDSKERIGDKFWTENDRFYTKGNDKIYSGEWEIRWLKSIESSWKGVFHFEVYI